MPQKPTLAFEGEPTRIIGLTRLRGDNGTQAHDTGCWAITSVRPCGRKLLDHLLSLSRVTVRHRDIVIHDMRDFGRLLTTEGPYHIYQPSSAEAFERMLGDLFPLPDDPAKVADEQRISDIVREAEAVLEDCVGAPDDIEFVTRIERTTEVNVHIARLTGCLARLKARANEGLQTRLIWAGDTRIATLALKGLLYEAFVKSRTQ